MCQCPHGLIPHCYRINSCGCNYGAASSVNALTGLYLIATKVSHLTSNEEGLRVNALTGLYLIAT